VFCLSELQTSKSPPWNQGQVTTTQAAIQEVEVGVAIKVVISSIAAGLMQDLAEEEVEEEAGGGGRQTAYYWYSSKNWHNLTQEQREHIQEARSIISNPISQVTGRRQIAGIEITPGTRDDASALTTPTAVTQSVANQPSTGDNAGNQFGQRSRGIGTMSSSIRKVSRVHSTFAPTDVDFCGFVNLDSHVDTCTLVLVFASPSTQKCLAMWHRTTQNMQVLIIAL
jgi:hypothetical protein